jgi:predicted CoA-binding protein
MNTKDDTASILSAKRIAIVGLSRDPKSYSQMVLREFKKRSYDIVGVNPNLPSIDGVQCYTYIHAIVKPVEAALIILPPDKSDGAVQKCLDANITKIWVRGAEGKRSLSDPLAFICAERGVRLVDGYCPIMFLDKPGFPHNLHGTFARWFKMVPK